jgi:NAD(P)-dependent dehydrogenase (short-subunit alcohol dehydrogenase family)
VSDRGWALILGASSGFGAASARAFASAGYNILGVHLDRRGAIPRVSALLDDLRATGRQVHFFNQNAARDGERAQMIDAFREHLHPDGRIRVVLHSLAFGTLRPLISNDDSPQAARRQIEMTVDVMAHSFVYWVQDLLAAGLLDRTRIFAMTSAGSHQAWPSYGPVSAAKATLESYVRQLSLELASSGHTVNAILAGVTDTPALSKIPGAAGLMASALKKNPHNRLTRPEDVAACLVELSRSGTYWMTGNIIRVDGGEDVCA